MINPRCLRLRGHHRVVDFLRAHGGWPLAETFPMPLERGTLLDRAKLQSKPICDPT